MTLKEEIEILRGEPIKIFTGDPRDWDDDQSDPSGIPSIILDVR